MKVKVTADITINHKGELFSKGDMLDVTEEIYKSIKDYVRPLKVKDEEPEDNTIPAETSYEELKAKAKEAKIAGYSKMTKVELEEALKGE